MSHQRKYKPKENRLRSLKGEEKKKQPTYNYIFNKNIAQKTCFRQRIRDLVASRPTLKEWLKGENDKNRDLGT